MKKLFFALLVFGFCQANLSAQSEAVKIYAAKSAETYCTCGGMVKAIDIQLAMLDEKISQEDGNAQVMGIALEVQGCIVELNVVAGDMEPTTAAQEQAQALTEKIISEKYPECAKKIARLSEKK